MKTKILIILIISSFIFFIYFNMTPTNIQIDESYKKYPALELPKEEGKTAFEVTLADELTAQIFISYERNEKNIRIKNISATNTEKPLLNKASIHINTTNTIHDSLEAVRITVNMSSSNIFNTDIGNSIVKLINNGNLIAHSKSEKVSDFKILQQE